MLGLGTSLLHSSPLSGTPLPPIATYASNFSSSGGVDGWSRFGLSSVDATTNYNQSIGGEDEAFVLSLLVDETVAFGVSKTNATGETFQVGDVVEYYFKAYSDDVNPQDDDVGNEFQIAIQAGNNFHSSRRSVTTNLSDGVWESLSGTINIAGGTDSNILLIYFNIQPPAPGIGDKVYLKDIVVNHYRP